MMKVYNLMRSIPYSSNFSAILHRIDNVKYIKGINKKEVILESNITMKVDSSKNQVKIIMEPRSPLMGVSWQINTDWQYSKEIPVKLSCLQSCKNFIKKIKELSSVDLNGTWNWSRII
jgi:hypothetical protein